MPSPHKVDVAIVGAGPVGLSLACELVRHGLHVQVFDKEPEPKPHSRAPVIWPRTQDALDIMGLHALWDGKTVPLRRMHINVYGKPAGTVELDLLGGANPTPMMVGQNVTEALLDEHLGQIGCPVRRSTEVVAVSLDAGGAQLTLRSGGETTSLEADWVIGCEGARSIVRQSMEVGWEGHALTGVVVPLADAQAAWPLAQGDGEAFAALTDRGYFLTLPLPGLRRIIVAIPDDTPEGQEPHADLERVERLSAEAIGGPVVLSDSPWVTAIRYGNHLAPAFRKGHALLAGDAAHAIAPLSGQGMNTGMQDALDLAWKLAYVQKGWAEDALLDSFNADRRPVATRLAASVERTFQLVQNNGKPKAQILKVAAPTVLSVSSVRDRIAEYFTERDVAYPDSPLNDKHHGQRPRPGDYVIDGQLVRWPELAPMRLFDALRGLHFTVLAFTGAQASADALGDVAARLSAMALDYGQQRLQALLITGLPSAPAIRGAPGVTVAIDAWRHVHEIYDAASGALLLVRPDGYVAFHRRASENDWAALEAHAEMLFRRLPITGGAAS